MADEKDLVVVTVNDKMKKDNLMLHDLDQRDEAGNHAKIGSDPIKLERTAFVAHRIAVGDLVEVRNAKGDVIVFGQKKHQVSATATKVEQNEAEKKAEEERKRIEAEKKNK